MQNTKSEPIGVLVASDVIVPVKRLFIESKKRGQIGQYGNPSSMFEFCNLRHFLMRFQKYFVSTVKKLVVFLPLRSRHADVVVVISWTVPPVDCSSNIWQTIPRSISAFSSFTLFLAKGKHLSTAEVEHHVSTYLLIRTGGRCQEPLEILSFF